MPTTYTLVDIPYLDDGGDYFVRLVGQPGRVWLDSSFKSANAQQYDIISAAPISLLSNPSASDIDTALRQLQHAQTQQSDSLCDEIANLPFCGGAIGYFNYEHKHQDFGLPAPTLPSLWGVFDWALIQNHQEQRSQLVFTPSCPSQRVEYWRQILCGTKPQQSDNTSVCSSDSFNVGNFRADTSKAQYLEQFQKIQNYIHAGDCYQINFAQRFNADFAGDAAAAYRYLRNALPGPYSAYLHLGQSHILSFSPEQFIEIDGRRAQSKPIKGTAPRNKDHRLDQQYADDLRASDKNRAENLMIVDLLRNDFSKSSEPWSVTVSKLFDLESYANVHHLVSTIQSKLNSEVKPIEFLLSCFPGGSITGAPKKRAMQIIDELETQPRNIYCGTIAYQSLNNKTNSNIAIRTLLQSGNKIYCWGGGGIVSDSTAESEYEESIQKVKVLMDTLQNASNTPNA